MKVNKYNGIIIICMLYLTYVISLEKENNFDQTLKKLYINKPALFEETSKPTTSKNSPSNNDFFQSLDKIIDTVALLSALVRIYYRHNQLVTTNQDTNYKINRLLYFILPTSMASLNRKIIWVKDACIITLETIVYKTVAK